MRGLVTPGAAAQPHDDRHAIAFPGLANLHSHAFQRGMAALAETAGPNDDDFWSWRETMYRFVLTLDPDQDTFYLMNLATDVVSDVIESVSRSRAVAGVL